MVAADEVEWFAPTSGRVLGAIGLVISVLVIVLLALDGLEDREPAIALAAAFFGVLTWATMLRPRAGVSADHLVLRNPVTETRIPLAAIEQVGLRQVLAVRCGPRRYVSPAVGRSMRSMHHGGRRFDPVANYPDFVEDRIHRAMTDARMREGVALMSDEQLALAAGVCRRWAWPEIAALGATSLGFVAAALL